mmetsp:Transcript_46515/g.101348  ORF Transcript_46515/g.101348 Transcript_46515/m.101348 type:complete len:210 (-) Transcript_46515:1645-2274(-)
MGSLIFRGKMPLVASALTLPVQMSAATESTSPPCGASTARSHSSQETSPRRASGTKAASASCPTPAEKTIFPTWPEPPNLSEFEEVRPPTTAFIACNDAKSKSTSPSGSSTHVEKNWRPPKSAAPSISEPRLPPSFATRRRRPRLLSSADSSATTCKSFDGVASPTGLSPRSNRILAWRRLWRCVRPRLRLRGCEGGAPACQSHLKNSR